MTISFNARFAPKGRNAAAVKCASAHQRGGHNEAWYSSMEAGNTRDAWICRDAGDAPGWRVYARHNSGETGFCIGRERLEFAIEAACDFVATGRVVL